MRMVSWPASVPEISASPFTYTTALPEGLAFASKTSTRFVTVTFSVV